MSIMAFVQSINSRKFSLNPLIISYRLNQFTNSWVTASPKPSSVKWRAEKLLWSVGLISDMINANEKYSAKRKAAKKFIIKCFDPTLQIKKSWCRAVPDDRFEVQNDLTCTNIGFSISALSREDGIWRKEKTNFSCCHLAVDIILRCLASCRAEQPPVSIRGLVLRYRARKKGRCIGRKLWSIVRSLDQERGPTFRVIGEAQILSFARLYYY